METTSVQQCILQDVGEIFLAVGVGGSIFYFLKGVCSSPKGRRLAGGAQAVVTNAPGMGRWAAWFSVLTVIERGIGHVRDVRHDPLNTMFAWAGANALFSMHQGLRAAACSALKGAVFGGFVMNGLVALVESLPDVDETDG